MPRHLRTMQFAIVDIETTGSTRKECGITEIAVVITDGKNVLNQWSSLINPMEPIPPRIVALTGINDAMVEAAPKFEEVALSLHALLADSIFVAHNVGFDYAFIRGHYEAIGMPFQRPKLCTVRLARKAIPGLPRYALGALCDSLGISHTNRHRAMGDAMATAELFHRMFMTPRGALAIDEALKRGTREHWMPQHVDSAEFDGIPNEPGVYWFLDGQGRPLYIGMSVHMQQRVRSHFSGTTASYKRQTLMREMRSLRHELAGSEWMAAVIEDVRIRSHWPPLNRAQKQPAAYRTVIHYIDRKGFHRLAIRTQRSSRDAIRTFHSEASARAWLFEQARSHQLIPEMLGLGTLGGETDVTLEEHQVRFAQALESWKRGVSGWFILPGRSNDERGIIRVSQGHVSGFGFVEAVDLHGDFASTEGRIQLDALSENLEPVAPSSTLDARLRDALESHPWIPDERN
ncbi:MAG: exonuclease domain-containing protein [Bacteroidetes bacterium]|nr:exonuclease domain-containing protein [Bacteroidota bacterium]MDA0903785.1 exonuclease domain-containing protein [Bacteroidota bacterium]